MTTGTSTPCPVKCKYGHDCVCDNKPKHPHTIHVCNVEGCRCHEDTQHMQLVVDAAGREFYVPQGARLVRKPVQA